MEDIFDYPGNLREPDRVIKKGCHSYFICRIECYRFRASSLSGLISQAQTRKFFHVRRMEFEVSQVHDREAQIGRDALRIGQGVEDGQTHIGHRKLSKYAAIHEL